jgi:hypothetical protein
VPANARRKCIEIESILPELAKEAAKRIGELHAIKNSARTRMMISAGRSG